MDHVSPNLILVDLDRNRTLGILGGRDPIKLHFRVGGAKLSGFFPCIDSRGPKLSSMDWPLDFGEARFNGISRGPPSPGSRVIGEGNHLEVRVRANPRDELLSPSRGVQKNTTK